MWPNLESLTQQIPKSMKNMYNLDLSMKSMLETNKIIFLHLHKYKLIWRLNLVTFTTNLSFLSYIIFVGIPLLHPLPGLSKLTMPTRVNMRIDDTVIIFKSLCYLKEVELMEHHIQSSNIINKTLMRQVSH